MSCSQAGDPQEAPPFPLGLPRCSHWAQRASEKSNPFYFPSWRPWELVTCEKRHRENHEGTRFFSSKEKYSKWPNGTVCLANRVASLVLSVLKPSQSWENPQGWVTLANSRPWSKWPKGIKNKAIAPISRTDDLMRLLIGNYGNNIPFVNCSVSVGPRPSPPLPPTDSRVKVFQPWHSWYFGLWDVILCIIGCLVASLAIYPLDASSTHHQKYL